MAAGQHLGEVAHLHVRVDLGRGEAAMPEELLDLADVGAAFQEMRRAAVTDQACGVIGFVIPARLAALVTMRAISEGSSSPPPARLETNRCVSPALASLGLASSRYRFRMALSDLNQRDHRSRPPLPRRT